MKTRTTKISKKISKISFNKIPKAGVWVGLFAIVGVTLLLAAKAASPYISIEAENGLMNGMSIEQMSSASGGSAVSFHAPGVPGPPGCGLPAAAFCETFDAPAGNSLAGGGVKTGDLNPVLWGVSRAGGDNPPQANNFVDAVKMSGPCGDSAFHPIVESFSPSAKATDVRICDHRMYEVMNDGGTVTSVNTYPKQPFDFTGRTGKVVFDVSSDSGGTHSAWPEFVITDKPVPGFRSGIPAAPVSPRHSIGFALTDCSGTNYTKSTAGHIWVTRNYEYQTIPLEGANGDVDGCMTNGTLTNLNHIEVEISTSSIVIYGTNPGSTSRIQLAHANNLGLTFSKGLVWLNDVHYNARKGAPCDPGVTTEECGNQWNHTFAWDNLGFDGPKTYRDIAANLPDANQDGWLGNHGDQQTAIGYAIGPTARSFTVPAFVGNTQTPTGAILVMTYWAALAGVPTFSLNGNTAVTTAEPAAFPSSGMRTIDIPITLSQLNMTGTNTLSFTHPSGNSEVANVSLILIAGAPVP